MSVLEILGAAATILLIAAAGASARRRVKCFADFATAGSSLGPVQVAGTIIGTIVGGASTVGAAQLAFRYGLSGWWFSLGSCFALTFLGVVLAAPMRTSGLKTIPQFLERSYGPRVGPWAWLFTSVGLMLNIIGQMLAAMSLLATVFGLGPEMAMVLTALMVMVYVMFGGVFSAGSVGIIKTLLLTGSMLAVGVATSSLSGGLGSFGQALPRYPYFSLFGRGVWVDLAAAFSLMVGVSSTQTYIQAMFSARDVKSSRAGALLSAALAPLLGIPGVAVGMFMRINHPDINAVNALPLFVTTYMNPLLSGIILATLFISVIGTAAGLSLGVSVMFGQDIYKKRLRPMCSDRDILVASRLAIIAVSAVALLVALSGKESLILEWSFLSMGLRGSTVFFPLIGAVFFPKYVSKRAGILAVGVAPACAIAWGTVNPAGLDPLYIGLATSIIIVAVGSWFMRDKIAESQCERSGSIG